MERPVCRKHELHVSRRDLLKYGLLSPGAVAIVGGNGLASVLRRAGRHLTIDRIDRVTVKVPYRTVPARNMARELPHWRYSEICSVTLRSGHVGHGETMLYYTWGATEDDDVRRVLNRNAAELMWDDELGAGLQMALFDAVAKAIDVPVHALLGQQINQRTPLSWWNIDTSAEDMAAECAEAHSQGYLAYKTKGRPWFDIRQQVDLASKAVPENFSIDMDFNDTLLTAEQGIPILKQLEQYPQIDIYETPIPQADVAGNVAIRDATRVAIAMHYGNPDPAVVVREGACDGFVIGGGATRVTTQGRFAAEADMPFWLQLVGTGITAAWSLHFGAVLSHATWPAVNCHQLYRHPLLTEPITVREGFAAIPNTPGLGYEIDWDAIQRYKVPKPPRRPDPDRLVETRWPDGRRMYFASNRTVNFVLRAGINGLIPYYEPGATTRLYPNNGSDDWKSLYQRACKAPVLIKS